MTSFNRRIYTDLMRPRGIMAVETNDRPAVPQDPRYRRPDFENLRD